jgi:hypothetical protein
MFAMFTGTDNILESTLIKIDNKVLLQTCNVNVIYGRFRLLWYLDDNVHSVSR